jgi:hypothetical protein
VSRRQESIRPKNDGRPARPSPATRSGINHDAAVVRSLFSTSNTFREPGRCTLEHNTENNGAVGNVPPPNARKELSVIHRAAVSDIPVSVVSPTQRGQRSEAFAAANWTSQRLLEKSAASNSSSNTRRSFLLGVRGGILL